jgi:hypothetical protein
VYSPDSEIAKPKWTSQNRSVVDKVRADWAGAQKARDVSMDGELRQKYDAGRILQKGMVGYQKALEKQKALRVRK